MEPQVLKNEHVEVTLEKSDDGKFNISALDLDDKQNDPRAYSDRHENAVEAFSALKASFGPKTTLMGAISILEDAGASMRYYCGND